MFGIKKEVKKSLGTKEETKEPIQEKKEIILDENKELSECIEFITKEHIKKLHAIQQGRAKKDDVLLEVEKYLRRKGYREKTDIDKIKEKVKKFIWGYYILEELIEDPNVSDIKILGKNNIRIKKLGKRMSTKLKFSSDSELKSFVNVVAVKNKINLSYINANQTFTDKESNKDFILRFTISTEYVNSVETPYLAIRKIPKTKYTISQLIDLGMGDKEQFDYLVDRIRNGECVIFTGKGASGKTSIMNCLLDKIEHDKSVLVIQENEELFSETHPDMMFQRVRYAKGEGKIEYNLRDLSIQGLLFDLDYFVIGEIKGAEALYFLNSCYTGHKAMASVHGNNSQQALNKLIDYMKYESDYSKEDLAKMLSEIDTTICYMKNFKIQEISRLIGYDEKRKNFAYNLVYKREEVPKGEVV